MSDPLNLQLPLLLAIRFVCPPGKSPRVPRPRHPFLLRPRFLVASWISVDPSWSSLRRGAVSWVALPASRVTPSSSPPVPLIPTPFLAVRLYVAIDFETQQTIRSGTLTTTVRWGSRPVWRARRQLCDHVMCPIPPGTFQLASVKSIPWIAPNGDYRLDVHGAMLLTGEDPHHLQADTEKVGEGQEEKEKNVRVQIPFKIK